MRTGDAAVSSSEAEAARAVYSVEDPYSERLPDLASNSCASYEVC